MHMCENMFVWLLSTRGLVQKPTANCICKFVIDYANCDSHASRIVIKYANCTSHASRRQDLLQMCFRHSPQLGSVGFAVTKVGYQ